MKFNKKILFVLILLALILPQGAFALNEDNHNVNSTLTEVNGDLDLYSFSVDDSIGRNDMKNENDLLDGLGSDCLDDESNLNLEGFSSYVLSNSDSQNSDAKDIKGNSYFVSE